MNLTQKRSLVATKMTAQFYLDITKYLLILLFAFGLFRESPGSAVVRPVLIVTAILVIVSASKRAVRNLGRIDEEEQNELQATSLQKEVSGEDK